MGMMEAIIQAQKLHRLAIEQTYDGSCTVTELQSIRDLVTKITSNEPVITLENIPCKLSVQSSPAVSATGQAAQVLQSIRLLLAPEISIKPGSRIAVTQNGITEDYQRSGLPAVYASHQEIELELFKGWA